MVEPFGLTWRASCEQSLLVIMILIHCLAKETKQSHMMEREGIIMDREMKKRGREGKDSTQHSLERSAKRQDADDQDDGIGSNMRLEDKSIALQVFDFPWLKDGIISESEWINFEDSFSSSLKDMDRVEFLHCEEQCLYENEATTCAVSLEKLEEINGWGLDMESVDSIWNFLNQPLEGGAGA